MQGSLVVEVEGIELATSGHRKFWRVKPFGTAKSVVEACRGCCGDDGDIQEWNWETCSAEVC